MLELADMRIFRAVAETGSFLAASEALHCAQSGVSQRMQRLEKELGTELFSRSRKGVSLTKKGELLLARAVRLLELADETESELRDDSVPSGAIRIGSLQTIAETVLPGILAAYHAKYPDVSLSVMTGNSEALAEAVAGRSADIAFTGEVPLSSDLEAAPFIRESLCLAVSSGESGFRTLPDLTGRTAVVFRKGCSYRKVLERLMEEKGIRPSGFAEMDSTAAIAAAVSAGMGAALLPESVLRRWVDGGSKRLLPLPEPFSAMQDFMIMRKDIQRTAALRELIRLSEEAAARSLIILDRGAPDAIIRGRTGYLKKDQ